MINMLVVNICAYILMAAGYFKSFEWSQTNGTKVTLILNYILFLWAGFMVTYLFSQYNNILTQPLNVTLNALETTTNLLIAGFFCSFTFFSKK